MIGLRRHLGLAALLAAACALLVPAPAGATAGAPKDLAAHPGSLVRVPGAYRPEFRWWWPIAAVDPAELRAELQAMKAAGFGAVEQSLFANARQWGSPAFRDRTRVALAEANRLGLRYDITLGPGWPVSSPSLEDLSREASVQDLHYGAVDLTGPATYSGPVPDRAPPGSARRRLVAVVAMRVAAPGSPTVLDPASAQDLTARVQPNGTLTWAAPPGSWKLFGFWMRPSLMRGKAGDNSQGWLVVDHFGRAAIDLVLRDFDRMLFGGDTAALLRRNGGDVFEDSYEVDHGAAAAGQSAVFWTPALPGEFKRRRGYSLTPLLPGLFGEFTFTGGLGPRLKHDFDLTLNDLLIDNHIRPIRRWANRKGLRSRSQAYQAGLGDVGTSENDRLAAAAQSPDVESLGFGDPNLGSQIPVELGSADGRAVLDRYRQVVSGAHLSGAKEITNEWGAVLNGQFRVRLADLKQIADRSLAAGVTRMALHGFAYRLYDHSPGDTNPRPSWPGWCSFCGGTLEFSDSWNQSWPQLKALPGLAAYLGRAGAALRSGRPRVDLSLVSATSVVNGLLGAAPSAGTPQDRLRAALQGAGFTWDALDPASIRSLGHAPPYKAFVVDDQAALPAAAATRLLRLAKAGHPVVLYGSIPHSGAGFKDARKEDATVRSAMRRLRRLPNVRVAPGPGTLLRALRTLDVAPDLRAAGGATTIVPVHRHTRAGDVWFLFNDSPRRVRRRLSFATTGAPTQIDLWTGRATRLAEFSRAGARVTLPLTLDPGATALLSFDRRRTGRGAHPVRRAGRPLPVTGPWALTAVTSLPGEESEDATTLEKLVPWESVPALRGRSGTGTYTATVQLPRRWLARRRGVLLDPGDFGGALRAWVNGRKVPVAPLPGQPPTDVTRLLRPGANALRLEVSTSLNNAIVTLGAMGDPDYAKYASRPLQTSGLLGPVRLIPTRRLP